MGGQEQAENETQIPQGLLYVEVDCPSELEAELHAWYNMEHIPERMRIPGFVSAHRYAALEGFPRWLAAYELESAAVMESPEYIRWLGPLQTAWTRRMVSSTRVCRSIFRLGRRVDSPIKSAQAGSAKSLLVVRCEPLSAEREKFRLWHDDEFCTEALRVSGVMRASRYDSVEGEEQLLLYEMEHPWVVQQSDFSRVWTAGWENQRQSLSAYRRTLYIGIL